MFRHNHAINREYIPSLKPLRVKITLTLTLPLPLTLRVTVKMIPFTVKGFKLGVYSLMIAWLRRSMSE